jgi:hypothetical protein
MNDDWTAEAAQFGLSPEEAEEHKRAWEDLQLLGPDGFVSQTLHELVEWRRTGQPADPAIKRRLQARNDVILAMTEVASEKIMQEYLQNFDGPRH